MEADVECVTVNDQSAPITLSSTGATRMVTATFQLDAVNVTTGTVAVKACVPWPKRRRWDSVDPSETETPAEGWLLRRTVYDAAAPPSVRPDAGNAVWSMTTSGSLLTHRSSVAS